MPTLLYRLTSPSGKQYIGVTAQLLERRIYSHSRNYHKTAIGYALQKYGKENFVSEILVMGGESYVYDLEQLAIQVFETLVPNGYNLREGGHGGRHSAEAKLKMSRVRKGIIFSDSHKENIAKVKTGNKASDKTRQKMSNSQRFRRSNESVETKQKFSETMKKVRANRVSSDG